MNLKDPKTDAEWQEAVNISAGLRMIADCQMYGLITGPAINVERCDELLEGGAERGITPQHGRMDLAMALIHQINAEMDKREGKENAAP